MMNSSIWVGLIVIGAIVVAISNIQYNRAREAENKVMMAKQALELLQPELQRNYEYLKKQKDQNLSFTIEAPFEVSAWETVSRSDLLLGLDSNTLSTLMQVYYLMNRANTLHKKYVDLTVGLESALHDSKKIREIVEGNLVNVIRELKPVLESVNEKSTNNKIEK